MTLQHVYRQHGDGSWHIADSDSERTFCGQKIGSSWKRHPWDARSGGGAECRRCRASSNLSYDLRLPMNYG